MNYQAFTNDSLTMYVAIRRLERFPLDLNREGYRGSLGRPNRIRFHRPQRRGVRDGEGVLERPAGAGRLDRRGR
jgi:hypothetical protein